MISESVSLQRLNTIVCRGVMNNRIIKLFLNYHIPVYVEIHNREPSISNRKYWQTYRKIRTQSRGSKELFYDCLVA